MNVLILSYKEEKEERTEGEASALGKDCCGVLVKSLVVLFTKHILHR